jgi:uncharacterized damage-inducible protein DinB
MTETHRLNLQLKLAHQGSAWHGPSLRELLDGVTAEQAAARPLPDAHSIWELVNHIAAWERIVMRRLQGEVISDVPDEINFPPVAEPGEAAWQAALAQLAETNRELREAIKQIDDAKLEELTPGKQHPLYIELYGALQHDLYHAGQIALLKKFKTP